MVEELVLEEDGTTPLELEESDDWATSTAYVIDDIVVHGGVVYRAIANHTSGATTEPGVGVDWEDDWESLGSPELEAAFPATDFAEVGPAGASSGYYLTDGVFEMSPDVDVSVGDILVAWVSCTSAYFFGPDGEQLPETYFGDSVGNRWQQLVSSYVFDSHVAMFVTRVKYTLHTTDTIQLKHYGGGAKCVYLHQFTFPDKRFALDFEIGSVVTTGNTASDPNAITISDLDPAREYLLLHVLGTEGPDTDTYTWDSDYTPIAGTGTTGHGVGPPTGDVHVRGGFRIVTGITTDTVDIASAIDRDNDQALLALTPLEVDEDYEGFTNTPLIDDFNRADETPIDGGIWEAITHPQFGDKWLAIDSNEVKEGAGTLGGGSQYTVEFMETDEDLGEYEMWGTLSVAHHAIFALGSGNGNAASVGATGVMYADSGLRAFNGGAPWDMGAIAFGDIGFGGTSFSDKTCLVWGHRVDGTKIGLQQLNFGGLLVHHLWMDDGSGWEWVAATIRNALSSSFVWHGQFSIAMSNSPTSRVDDFGGGPLDRFIPQIIRRPPDVAGAKLRL